MSDLISKSALLKYCRKVVEYDEAGYSVTFNAVSVEDIKNEPTVEVVPKEKIQKVLERLKDKADAYEEMYNRTKRNGFINERTDAFADALMLAIEIIEEGVE
jgi:hypothetical protein